jgi:hypothetical protein
MGHAAYNRGSDIVRRDADEHMPAAAVRTANATERDSIAQMRATIENLESELRRARRCIRAERNARALLATRIAEHESAYRFAVTTLCKAAFSPDPQT